MDFPQGSEVHLSIFKIGAPLWSRQRGGIPVASFVFYMNYILYSSVLQRLVGKNFFHAMLEVRYEGWHATSLSPSASAPLL